MSANESATEVREVSSPFRPSAGPSNPMVWQDEVGAVLICETDEHCPDARGVLRFQSCLQTRFGYPNDEALPGHPLHDAGLRYYALFARYSTRPGSANSFGKTSLPSRTIPTGLTVPIAISS